MSPRFGCLAYTKAKAVHDLALNQDLALDDGDKFQGQALAVRPIRCVENLAGEFVKVRSGWVAAQPSHAALEALVFRRLEQRRACRRQVSGDVAAK